MKTPTVPTQNNLEISDIRTLSASVRLYLSPGEEQEFLDHINRLINFVSPIHKVPTHAVEPLHSVCRHAMHLREDANTPPHTDPDPSVQEPYGRDSYYIVPQVI